MFFGCLSSRRVKSCFCSPRTAAPDLSVTCTSSVICRSGVLGGGSDGPAGLVWSWGGVVFCVVGAFCCATAASGRSSTRNHRKNGLILTHLAVLGSVRRRGASASLQESLGPGVPRKQ